jgi:hypothetical protein
MAQASEETDSLGAVKVSAENFRRALTQYPLLHFIRRTDLITGGMVAAYGIVSRGAANGYQASGRLSEPDLAPIVRRCDESVAGNLRSRCPLQVWGDRQRHAVQHESSSPIAGASSLERGWAEERPCLPRTTHFRRQCLLQLVSAAPCCLRLRA